MVSVITLTYKNFDNLFKTIASVLDQDYPEFEYFISDDGSPNFPKQEIIDFVEKNKKNNLIKYEVIANTTNVGTVKHLNGVMRRCEGEYIFDLSSDDTFIDGKVISRMVEAFQKEKCDVLIVSRINCLNGKNIGICPHYYDWKNVLKLNTREKMYSAFMKTEHFDMFISPNVFYKKSVIERNDFFDEKYVLFEDAPMIEKILWNENVCIKPDIISIVYDCGSGVSAPWKKNRILTKDIKKYNLFGKLNHFNELDIKTKKHIKFGIEREQSKNFIQLTIVCIKYFPRIFEYSLYTLLRWICGIGDYKKMKDISIVDYTIR